MFPDEILPVGDNKSFEECLREPIFEPVPLSIKGRISLTSKT